MEYVHFTKARSIYIMKKGFMKKSAAAMMAMSVGLSAMPAAPISAEEITATYRYADLNGDGAIDVLDLVCMKRGYQNPDSLTAVQRAICDLNADGTFDADDITVLQEYLVNRIAEFPSGQIYSKPSKRPTLTTGRKRSQADAGSRSSTEEPML